jgi:hypothetical protein
MRRLDVPVGLHDCDSRHWVKLEQGTPLNVDYYDNSGFLYKTIDTVGEGGPFTVTNTAHGTTLTIQNEAFSVVITYNRDGSVRTYTQRGLFDSSPPQAAESVSSCAARSRDANAEPATIEPLHRTSTEYRATVRRISTQEVAERAGVDLDYVGRLVDLGLLVPDGDGTFSEGDARRARLYRGLERAGLPTEAMIAALERGELSFAFLDLPVYERFASLSQASFREVSSEKGIPLELLLVVREAIGFAQADADDRMRDDELGIVPIIALLLSRGVDPAVIERLLRVYGDALRRITEAEADWGARRSRCRASRPG